MMGNLQIPANKAVLHTCAHMGTHGHISTGINESMPKHQEDGTEKPEQQGSRQPEGPSRPLRGQMSTPLKKPSLGSLLGGDVGGLG